ncbi:glycoside hydrolase family 172 protein [Candidatus Hydrogenedentota bacterium]
MENLARLQNGRSLRSSSWDRTGANRDYIRDIEPGGSRILLEEEGAGQINHIYFTVGCFDPLWLRCVRIRMFWDGEETPSVDVPFGDFFATGNCVVRHFTSLMITVNPGMNPAGTDGYNIYFPMPFSDGARIEIVNDGIFPVSNVWFHIDYELRESIDPELGRFHAQWRRTKPDEMLMGPEDKLNLTGAENYRILEAEGRGHYMGCALFVDNLEHKWWGEGDDMIFIDGESWPPSIHGTGTEEIFGGGACPAYEYAGPYTGFHLISNDDYFGKTSMYRWCVADPVRFSRSISVSIEHGHANDRPNDYSSVAYWYQAEPHAESPVMRPAEERIPIGMGTIRDWIVHNKDELGRYARGMTGGIGIPPERIGDFIALCKEMMFTVQEQRIDDTIGCLERIFSEFPLK